MRPAAPTDRPSAPETTQKFLDGVCLRFHADWQAGRRPRIEHALGALPEPSRSLLLRALLGIELEHRLRRGEEPDEAEYQTRFPESAAFLPALLAEARRRVAPPRRPAPGPKPTPERAVPRPAITTPGNGAAVSSPRVPLPDEPVPILAGPPAVPPSAPVVYRLRFWARHNPRAVGALALLSVALLLATATAVLALVRLGEAQATAAAATDRAEAASQAEAAARREQATAQREVGRLALRRGAWREALEAFDRCRDGDGGCLERVRACLALGRAREAEAELGRLTPAQLVSEQAGRVDLYRAQLLLNVDPRAEEMLRTALVKGLPPAEQAFARGLVEAKTSAEALAHFQRAVALDPFHEEARSAAALLLVLLGRREEAGDLLTRSEALFPESLGLTAVRFVAAVLDGDAVADKHQAALAGPVSADDLDALRAGLEAVRPLLEALTREPSAAEVTRLVTQLLRVQRLTAARRPAEDRVPLNQLLLLPPFLTPMLTNAAAELLPLPLGAPVTREVVQRAARLAEAHPEGTLAGVHARLALAHAEQHRPGTGQDDRTYTELLREAASAYEAAARRPGLLPVRLTALEKLIHIETLLGAPERARPDAAMRTRAVAHVRERLALTPPVRQAEMWEVFWTAAANAGEHEVARQVLGAWERQQPDDVRLVRCRAYTEFSAGAYGPAARAAREALLRSPTDPLLKRVLAQSLERHRAEARETAP